MVKQEYKGSRSKSCNLCGVWNLTLYLLFSRRYLKAEVADVQNLVKRYEILHKHFSLIERLLFRIKIKLLPCLDRREMNLLEIIECTSDISSIASGIPVGKLGV